LAYNTNTTHNSSIKSVSIQQQQISNVKIPRLTQRSPEQYPHQPTFSAGGRRMAMSLQSLYRPREFYQRAFLAMVEPVTISCSVGGLGVMHFNRGWRVEFSRYVMYCSVNSMRRTRTRSTITVFIFDHTLLSHRIFICFIFTSARALTTTHQTFIYSVLGPYKGGLLPSRRGRR
jgi:hypothetical protein